MGLLVIVISTQTRVIGHCHHGSLGMEIITCHCMKVLRRHIPHGSEGFMPQETQGWNMTSIESPLWWIHLYVILLYIITIVYHRHNNDVSVRYCCEASLPHLSYLAYLWYMYNIYDNILCFISWVLILSPCIIRVSISMLEIRGELRMRINPHVPG